MLQNPMENLDGKMPEPPPSATAVSIFGSNGRDEFPVLKAFQEYVDAEQSKARKRMLGLSIFFVVLLCIFTLTFVLSLGWLFQRNQRLEDRIFEMSEKERDRVTEQAKLLAERTEAARKAGMEAATAAVNAAVKLPQSKSAEEALRPYLDKLEAERKAERAAFEAKLEAERKALAAERARVAEAEARRQAAEKKRKAEEEKRKALEEKEKKRQAEVERHRRRLYPEYYAEQDAAQGNAARRKTATPAAPKVTTPSAPPSEAPSRLLTLKPVSYFQMTPPAPKTEAPAKSAAPAVEKPVTPPKPRVKTAAVDVGSDDDAVKFLIEETE